MIQRDRCSAGRQCCRTRRWDIKVGDHLLLATSDDRGYLEVTLPGQVLPPAVPVEIHRTPGYDAAALPDRSRSTTERRVWAAVSDVDDTVLDSQITDKSKMVKTAAQYVGTW